MLAESGSSLHTSRFSEWLSRFRCEIVNRCAAVVGGLRQSVPQNFDQPPPAEFCPSPSVRSGWRLVKALRECLKSALCASFNCCDRDASGTFSKSAVQLPILVWSPLLLLKVRSGRKIASQSPQDDPLLCNPGGAIRSK